MLVFYAPSAVSREEKHLLSAIQYMLKEVMVGGDSAPLLWWDPSWNAAFSRAPSIARTWPCRSEDRAGPQRRSEGWSISSMRAGRESLGCPAWRSEGSEETLLLPSNP